MEIPKTLYCGHCKEEVGFTYVPAGRHLKANCLKCGQYIKFLSYVPLEAFIMPFGKHKGELLAEAIKAEPRYFQWLAGNTFSKSLKEKINTLLSRA